MDKKDVIKEEKKHTGRIEETRTGRFIQREPMSFANNKTLFSFKNDSEMGLQTKQKI